MVCRCGHVGRFKTDGEICSQSLVELRLVGDHLLVKNAHNANPAELSSIKHNMPSNLEPPQLCLESLAGSANQRVFSENLKGIFQLVQIAICLKQTPRLGCIFRDPIDIRFSFA